MLARLRFVLALAAALGLGEVALRASPLRGLDAPSGLQWAGLAVVLAAVAIGGGLAVGAVAQRFKALARFQPETVAVGLVGGLLTAVNYRYEFVLNEFVRSPTVFLGVPAAFLVGGLLAGAFAHLVPLRPAWLAGMAVIAGVVAAVRADPDRGTASPRPNVLVVSMDTVRADSVAGMPAWERLRREGVVFDDAVAAAPITEPSHLAMFTGIAPYRSGIVSNGTPLGERDLIWKRLQAEGWLTAGFVAGFPLHGKYGWGQGMNVYDDDFGAWPGGEALSFVKAWNQVALREHALRERTAERVMARAERWIRTHRNETFFAFIHFYDAHGPYQSPYNAELGAPPQDGTPLELPLYWPAQERRITSADWLKKAYLAEIRTVDDAVGQLLDALGDQLDNTVVIITADHGESLTEHGVLFDHGDDLYDPSLRIPLVVRFPPKAHGGLAVACQVGGVDIAPTILELLGQPIPEGIDGRSRVSELGGGACTETPVVSSTTAGRFVADPPVDHSLRGGGTKLIRKERGPAELYDLRADPEELRNLAPSSESEQRMQVLDSLLTTGASAVAPSLDAETRSALEALGYVEEETP